MITFQTISILFGCIVVLMVPATRTELRNTRESPLLRLEPPSLPAFPGQREWIVNASGNGPTFSVAVATPYNPPTTGYRPQRRPAKRRIPAGHGHSQLGHGPLAWIWAELDPHAYPVRAASDWRILAGAA